jgi:pimeloyl-ACP methyl ester carboxylesterase
LRWGGGSDRVLLLHEPGADIDGWGALPSTLAGNLALEITAIDLPGHGLSDDPWQEERLPDLVREFIDDEPRTGRQFVIAAGAAALAILEIAAESGLAGLVALSPTAVTGGRAPARSPRVPKLLFAGALAGNDVQTARELATRCGGWALVTAVPLADRGTEMLASAWQGRIIEQTTAFLHDCIDTRPICGRGA